MTCQHNAVNINQLLNEEQFLEKTELPLQKIHWKRVERIFVPVDVSLYSRIP
jgi:hypothetical protein